MASHLLNMQLASAASSFQYSLAILFGHFVWPFAWIDSSFSECLHDVFQHMSTIKPFFQVTSFKNLDDVKRDIVENSCSEKKWSKWAIDFMSWEGHLWQMWEHVLRFWCEIWVCVQMSTNCANVYIVFEFPSSHFFIWFCPTLSFLLKKTSLCLPRVYIKCQQLIVCWTYSM